MLWGKSSPLDRRSSLTPVLTPAQALAHPLPRQEGSDSGGGQQQQQRCIIEVTTDEAVGVALAIGRQVYVAEDMWEGGRVSLKDWRSLRKRCFFFGIVGARAFVCFRLLSCKV